MISEADYDRTLSDVLAENAELKRKLAEAGGEYSSRVLDYMKRTNERDEAHHHEYINWLEGSDDARRAGIAATALFDMLSDSATGYLCNYSSAKDGHGKTHQIGDVIEGVKTRLEEEFLRITGIRYHVGMRDAQALRDYRAAQKAKVGS